MRYNRANSLNNILKVVVLTLLISFSLNSACFSQGESVGKLDRSIEELRDEDYHVRMKAAEALGKIKDVRAVEPLIAALKNEGCRCMKNAAEALGKIKDTRAVEPLIAALKDEHSEVRSATVKALGEMKDVRAVEPLIAALKDNILNVQGAVAYALISINTPAIDPLIAALKGENSNIRSGAAKALGGINDARAVEPLIAALKDENLEIIAGAHSFFIRRGGIAIEGHLIQALDKYGTIVMAENFLNCGNEQLSKAAREWAKRKGYSITTYSSSGSGGPKWGGKQ